MQLRKLSDTDLVSRYINGNEKAFEVLLTRHQSRVYSYIFMMVKNNELANDIFQDAFTKIILTLKKGKYNDEGKFLPWVMRITHNLVIDYFRKSSKMNFVGQRKTNDDEDFNIFDVLNLEEGTIEDELVLEQVFQDVRDLVELLPEDQLEIVKMRHFRGMSFKDIAEAKDISINTALGRMRYALINLRKLVKEKNLELTVA